MTPRTLALLAAVVGEWRQEYREQRDRRRWYDYITSSRSPEERLARWEEALAYLKEARWT